MNKYLYIFLLIFTFSCDVQEEPFYNDFDSYINPEKKILIEDFTGHKCQNCPDASKEIKAIQNLYPNQVIALAIHVSSFAKPNPLGNPYDYDFRTKWGNEIDNLFEISNEGLPAGMVNRVNYLDDNHRMGKDEWANAVNLELKKSIDFRIHTSCSNNNINILVEVINSIENTHNIFVCLAENNVINYQQDGSLTIEDYEHEHVLRSVIIDESLSNEGEFNTGDIIEKSYSIDIDALENFNITQSLNLPNGNGNAGGWDENNLTVITYVYNTVSKEIVQVEEVSLN